MALGRFTIHYKEPRVERRFSQKACPGWHQHVQVADKVAARGYVAIDSLATCFWCTVKLTATPEIANDVGIVLPAHSDQQTFLVL